MSKFECTLKGDFNNIVAWFDNGIIGKSVSASFEDGSDYLGNNVRVAVRVYERYSVFGKNRVSLNLTFISEGEDVCISAITSGGSQAVFYKVNTISEENFLDSVRTVANEYISSQSS